MIRLHNTLGNSLEEFKPIKEGEVKMYHCGPTVYDYAHIGNLRSYVFADILRRTFEYLDYKVEQVVNITDIGHLTSDADSGDDKMVKGLKRENLPITLDGLKQLADKYEQTFKDDLKSLNILTPHHFPRATEYLEQEINLIKKLEENGFAYTISDGVYFDTNKDKNYGRLGGIGGDESRIASNPEKRDNKDFVLWKFSKDDHLGFSSPWGVGFPGWHIECSAMSRELLGQPFDIHTGGIDHIPVHHNNEIAQSEAAYNKPLANYWMHNEFVVFSGEKMAKSENNFITLKSIEEKGFSPLAYRYFLLGSHYKTPTNFTWEGLEGSSNAWKKLKEIKQGLNTLHPQEHLEHESEIVKKYKESFIECINNDLGTPQALAIVWNAVKDSNLSPLELRHLLWNFDKILGLRFDEELYISDEVKQLLVQREEARTNQDFDLSDNLRKQIEDLGYTLKDTDKGPILSSK
jgi:cysteinyl-tRNA synthetase